MAHLALTIEDQIATVTFSNPPLQVMTPTTLDELNALLPRLREDDVRAVVLTGSDAKYFIRHFSVEEMSENAEGGGNNWDLNDVHDLFSEIEHLPKPVITALTGTAMGGGLELALATDIRVAKDGPFRYGLPEISIGVLPGGGGTQRLSTLVGRSRAMEMMLRPRLITPAQALQYGLIEELVPEDASETALDRAQSIAREIASRPRRAVAHIKRLARQAVSPVSKDMLAVEAKLYDELLHTPEARELLRAVADAHRKEREVGVRA
jgi:enoyl-CoA hydratase/carnithine racemase